MNWFNNLAPSELPSGTLLIDVRSTNEYMSGHVPGAINLPLPHFEQELVHKAPELDTPIVVYCATGARSELALGWLQRSGYTRVCNGGGANELAKQLHRPLSAPGP
ncbi:MAG TPA: rhodanese-like domain-containing protein [Burkholderiaceae bacterium]